MQAWRGIVEMSARFGAAVGMAGRAAAAIVLALATPTAARAQAAVFSARVDAVRVERRRAGAARRWSPGSAPATSRCSTTACRSGSSWSRRRRRPSTSCSPWTRSTSLDAEGAVHLTAAGAAHHRRAAARETAALVTFSDRVAIQSDVHRRRRALKTLVGAPMPTGDTAVNDAAHVAMLVGSTAPGRPIVILFSDGADTASFLTGSGAGDGARTGPWCASSRSAARGRAAGARRLTGGVFVKEASLARVAEALRRDPRELPAAATW